MDAWLSGELKALSYEIRVMLTTSSAIAKHFIGIGIHLATESAHQLTIKTNEII